MAFCGTEDKTHLLNVNSLDDHGRWLLMVYKNIKHTTKKNCKNILGTCEQSEISILFTSVHANSYYFSIV